MLTVIIPWRAQPSRIGALDAVTGWYRAEFPVVDIRLIDSGDDVFNLAQSRNLGVASASDPDAVVVVNDADTIPESASLRAAIAAASRSGLVHLPYSEYRWLGAAGMAQFGAGLPIEKCVFDLVRGACSGVYVTTPRSWLRHGGQDERFRGWGYEDAAWYLAHETLLGEVPRRHPGRVFALHHVAEPRSGPQFDANAELMARYREASGDVVAMRTLVHEAMAENARTLPGS